jgi:outer membrane lipoprotein-sorting protein
MIMIMIMIITITIIAIAALLLQQQGQQAEAITNSKLSAFFNATRDKAIDATSNQTALIGKVTRIGDLCVKRLEVARAHLDSDVNQTNATIDSDIAALNACQSFKLDFNRYMTQLINETKQQVYTILFG